MHRLALGFAAAGLALLTPMAAGAARAPALERLSTAGRWFVDSHGRVVTLRGGNVTLPPATPPAVPKTWTARTPAHLAEQGFNGVRLVIFFADLMPQPGKIDSAYLDRIAAAVAAYKAAGVYTLIDFHQDEYGPQVGVRGLPPWATFSDGYVRAPGLEFPMGYFNDPAVQRAFDNFWSNRQVPGVGRGVQDLYVDGLVAVALRFRDEPAVIGLDVMNEPSTGSRCAKPDPQAANCPELEDALLKPFYRRAGAAVNAAAPQMIVFFEPFMLQGALGTPINTPLPAAEGRRGFSFHNYGPVRETRNRINGYAVSLATRRGAGLINTEWGFSNDPAEVIAQADDFDAIQMSWLAWPRGAFEALVDPALPDRGNGQRLAILRAYARPYAETTAGTPQQQTFDAASGVFTYRFLTKAAGRGLAAQTTTIRIPSIQYPQGYRVRIEGGVVASPANAAALKIRSRAGVSRVTVSLQRIGDLPPLPPARAEAGPDGALQALPPIPPGPLTRRSMLGHIVATPGGRALLERHVPGMLRGLSHVHGWERMSLSGIQQFASGVLNDATLSQIDAELAQLQVTPGPVPTSAAARLSVDSLVSDLLADPQAREILERHAPGLATAPQRALYPQTRLRALQPAMPTVLTETVLQQINQELAKLR